MKIKIFSFLAFVLIWLGLVGIPYNMLSLSFLIIVPLITFIIAWKLSLLPEENFFNFRIFSYLFWLAREIIVSAITVSKIAWRRNLRIRPSLEPIKSIQTNEVGITTYANSITLTPGTVTLSTEDNILLVHALDTEFMDGLKDGVMDKKIKQIMRK